MSLLAQIQEKSKEISTDSYSMSVGELLTMYKDKELDLHPEFQRFFRWTPEQKSRLIESLLLGIPIPSVFVSQINNGTWEVVDGLQRLSTLFELVGELRDREGDKIAPLVLTKTKYLPELEGLRWESENLAELLPDEAKLKIKRSRVDVNILLNTSDLSAKYELFQRLNTGGSLATEQEVRNCILVMVNRDFFSWMAELAKDENFKSCIPLTERALEEQYDLELLTRFLVFRALPLEEIKTMGEVGTFLDDQIVKLAEDSTFDREEAALAFKRTFNALAQTLNQDSFRRYDAAKSKSSGAMLTSIFEVIAIGLGHYAGNEAYIIDDEKINLVHQRISGELRFNTASGSGVRASTRIPTTIQLGREYFAV